MAWVRSGECNRCGECCRSGDPFNGEEGQGPVAGACPLFAFAEDGKTGICTNRQHKYYLNGCQVWPSQPSHIEEYPSCSYTFEWVE